MTERSSDMERLLPSLLFTIAILLAACGSDAAPVSTAGDDGGEPLPREDETAEEITVAPNDETVITNGDAVDPRVTTPGEVVLNPDDPTELWVRFVGGDPNCTAARATLLMETPDAVSVELLVGITQDALARSCQAGEFNLRVDVALSESAEGKAIGWTQAPAPDAPLVTSDLSTDDFVGLTQSEAEAIAREALIPFRVTRVDDKAFDVTDDDRPERLNFRIDDGVVTSASLG